MKRKSILVFVIMLILFSGCSLLTQPNTNINIDDGVPRNESGDSILENNSINVRLHDGNGEPLSSLHGSLNIHDAHSHTELYNHFYVNEKNINTTTNGTTSQGDVSINVFNASGFSVGDYIDINNGTEHQHMYKQITIINGNTITLDGPLDIGLINNSLIEKAIINMNVNGNLTHPVSFRIFPREGEILHITRFLITIISPAAADDSKFGGIAALTNGVILRTVLNNETHYHTMTNWKTNGNMKEDMYDVADTDKAGGGNYGVNGRWTLTNADVIVRLNGTSGDYIEILIQDDLTSLIDFQVKGQAHFEE